MPSRTPSCCAVGTRSAIASATMRRARARSRLPDGSPPETRTRVSAPSSAASAMARRLSARALARAGPSGWVKKPPRQRLDTCRPAARTVAAARRRPASATRSRHSPIAGISMPDAQVHALRQVKVLHRGLIEGQPVAAERAPGHRRPAEARYPVIRSAARAGERSAPAAAASSKTRTRWAARPPGLEAVQHGEVRLQAVQPGQERDADLVAGGGWLEDRPAQLRGGPHGRVVAGQVAGVERVQRGRGRGGDRGEGAEQRVTVARQRFL